MSLPNTWRKKASTTRGGKNRNNDERAIFSAQNLQAPRFAFLQKVVITEETENGNHKLGFFQSVIKKFKVHDRERRQTRDIMNARRKLGELGLSLGELNLKIERIEKIAEKWKERQRSG